MLKMTVIIAAAAGAAWGASQWLDKRKRGRPDARQAVHGLPGGREADRGLPPNQLVRVSSILAKLGMPAARQRGKSVPLQSGPAAAQPTDYSAYVMTAREKWLSAAAAGAALALIGALFYKSWIIALGLSLIGLLYPARRAKTLADRRRRQLTLQFKQALASLSSLLGAGKSVETAFREAVDDLLLLYPDPDTAIVRELQLINRKVENGGTIEQALADFSARACTDDIRNFTDVFLTCKRTGGNLVHVIRRTATIIHEKLEIEQEIGVMISQKKFESRLLTFAPLVVVAVLCVSSPDYMAPLYSGPGYIVMTVCLLVLFGCQRLADSIMNIKV